MVWLHRLGLANMIFWWCAGGLAFCWFLQRLVIQSSYYADPNKRFCGTLERFFVILIRLENKLLASLPYRLTGKPTSIDREELKHYAGVKQFWLDPFKAPKCNQWADKRFKERRDEMARREALSAAKIDSPPIKGWHLVLATVSLVCLGLLTFFTL